MIHEYAVDPEILADFTRCNAFFQSFINQPSRLISDLPKHWEREAFRYVNSLPHELCKPVMRKTLKNNLRKLTDSVLVKNRTVGPRNAAQGWEAYAVQENSPNAFSGIFVAEPGARYGNVYPFDSLLVDCPECWMSGNQLHVVREAPVMVETAMPLLRISKTIKLVDPYFTFFDFETWDRYRPLLLELFNRSSEYNFGRGNDRLEIHTSDKWGSMAPQLRKFVDSELAAGCSIKVYHWPHSEIHDRFILTDLGGLSFGHGLDEHTFNNAREVLVTVLDRAAYKRELRKTLRAAPPLTYSYPEV